MITILDYGAGNVRSVANAITRLGETIRFVQKPEDITSADKLVFPGVGAFGSMMKSLRQKDYINQLRDYLRSDRPFLGICLGLQALFDVSEEAPGVPGLGIIRGRIRRFDIDLSVPHIGWNGISSRKASPLFHRIRGDEKFYFVHSYYADPKDESDILARTHYGIPFTSAVQKGNIAGTQFHPEKSGKHGLTMLENFISEKPTTACPPEIRGNTTRLAKRIVACLDVRANDAGDLIVTKGDQYDVRENGAVRNMGKPVNMARQYYRDGADEITFLNITGFRDFPLKDMPMLEVLRRTSKNVFVPLTIGGGIRDYTDTDGRHYTALEVASEYFRSGADKVSIGSEAVLIAEAYMITGQAAGNSAIEEIARVYGNQAVVISIDPKRVYVESPKKCDHHVIETEIPGPEGERYCWFQCTIRGGRQGRDLDAVVLAEVCEKLGAGEILLNSIDKDGANSGFDLELIRTVSRAVTIPVIASSGAGNPGHFRDVFTKTRAEAALAAGIFHRGEVSIREVKKSLATDIEIRQPNHSGRNT